MREIKFRTWNGKEMIVPTAIINGKAAILKRCNDDREMTDDEGVHYYCNWDMDVVTDYPLMQFTGLQDKNGVDIYKDDVVQFSNKVEWYASPVHSKEQIKEIVTDHVKYPYERRCINIPEDYEWLLSSEIQYHWEIIGNIHENPELKN
jgi:uncharacterized phage protein (TIGR01671 family)